MCGIAGILTSSEFEIKTSLVKMSEAIAHRGPDSNGFYIDNHIGLAHRRLSIIDLSVNANQPMHSYDDRFIIVYNGEIYNFLELKKELNDYPFVSKSDTEVIIASFLKWGINCFEKFNGMFAFGLWDKYDKLLYLVRDRNGIKPLYYSFNNEQLLFSSEMRSIIASGKISKELNKSAILEYIQYQTVHFPNTLINDINTVEAGHYLKIRVDKILHLDSIKYTNVCEYSDTDVSNKTYKEIKRDIFQLLLKSVEQKMIADVPIGAFLSGGIDSSIIVGLMSQIYGSAVNTFNVNFDESEYSESRYARIISNKFKTNHNEICLTPNDFLESLPYALSAIDHPSGDGPNTWIVSKEVQKKGIKVAFSGLGGDELFAGYAHFKRAMLYKKYSILSQTPIQVKNIFAYLIRKAKPSISVHKLIETLNKKNWDFQNTYPINRRMFLDTELSKLLYLDITKDRVKEICESIPLSCNHILSQITVAEFNTYMQHVLLRDTDQMTMSIPIEGRLPFLDNNLISYVLSIPDKYKNPITPKKLLVESVGDLIPLEIINRPKMGFVFPWDKWIKNELYDFCEYHISYLCDMDFIQSETLRKYWKNFLMGYSSISWSRIWCLVVLSYWMKKYDVQ